MRKSEQARQQPSNTVARGAAPSHSQGIRRPVTADATGRRPQRSGGRPFPVAELATVIT